MNLRVGYVNGQRHGHKSKECTYEHDKVVGPIVRWRKKWIYEQIED